MALEYMNKQNALKTRSILYSNEWKTFCAVGNASALFWKSLETRGGLILVDGSEHLQMQQGH